MKVAKGKPGYVKAQKNNFLTWTLVGLVIAVVIVAIGYWQMETFFNFFTLAAVIVCIPTIFMFVKLLKIISFKTIDLDKAAEIEEKSEYLTTVYDLILKDEKSLLPVDAIVISNNTVFGYASNKKAKPEETAAFIKECLNRKKFGKTTVKVFPEYVAFLSRVEGLNNIMAIEKMDTKKMERAIRKRILNFSK